MSAAKKHLQKAYYPMNHSWIFKLKHYRFTVRNLFLETRYYL